jgi:hypothetical protein
VAGEQPVVPANPGSIDETLVERCAIALRHVNDSHSGQVRVATETKAETVAHIAPVELYKITADLLGAFAWPVVVIGFYLVFKKQLHAIAALLPGKLSSVTEFQVGSLKIAIEKQTAAMGNFDLAARMTKLSPDGMRLLLRLGSSGTGFLGPMNNSNSFFYHDRELPVAKELVAEGLAEISVPDLEQLEAWIRGPGFTWKGVTFTPVSELTTEEKSRLTGRFGLTDLGRKAFSAVLNAVSAQLKSEGESAKVAP